MSDFKVGSKVRNKVTGDVASFYENGGEYVFVSMGTEIVNPEGKDLVAAWLVDDCELYVENKPVLFTDDQPKDIDYDNMGWVMARTTDGLLSCVSKSFVINSPEKCISWWHTPDWRYLEPLLTNCDDCEHLLSMPCEKGNEAIEARLCHKHKKWFPKPHYIGNAPCHLAAKDDE